MEIVTEQPQPAQPNYTHAAVPMQMIGQLSRLLTRMVTEGQEAMEVIQSLQQCRPISLSEPKEEARGITDPAGGSE